MARRKTDYRALYKALTKVQTFGFKLPRKGQDFSPQQKSRLTSEYKRLKQFIGNENASFIPYKKGTGGKFTNVDAVRTAKGIFYKLGNAKAVYNRKDKKYHIRTTPVLKRGKELVSKFYQTLFVFPPSILGNPQLIMEYVEALKEKYSPDDIKWSTPNRRESPAYDASIFMFYFTNVFTSTGVDDLYEPELDDEELTDDEIKSLDQETENKIWRKRKYQQKSAEDEKFYNGVFLVYYTN